MTCNIYKAASSSWSIFRVSLENVLDTYGENGASGVFVSFRVKSIKSDTIVLTDRDVQDCWPTCAMDSENIVIVSLNM